MALGAIGAQAPCGFESHPGHTVAVSHALRTSKVNAASNRDDGPARWVHRFIAARSAAAYAGWVSKRVLVIDDDSAIRDVVTEALSDAGFDCMAAATGAHGLDLARDASPDAVVLDILMPDLSGDDVYHALRRGSLTRYTPVIFLTAQREAGQKVKRLLDGADDYMTKPFDTDELAARVSTAISRSQELRALNPLSGLPGNLAITGELGRLLEDGRDWACLYCDVDHFKEFNDHYGFARGDELIVALARLLVEVAETMAPDGFVGHIGGDDFVMLVPDALAETAADEIARRFDAVVPSLYDDEDRRRGHITRMDRRGIVRDISLATVSIGIVPVRRDRFSSAVAVSRAAAELKEVAKRSEGSGWAVDRRQAAEHSGSQPVA